MRCYVFEVRWNQQYGQGDKLAGFWREGYLLPTLARKITLPTFRLNAPVVFRAKVKRCEQTLLFIAMHYWGYTSLEVKGRWGLLLPPCLLITAIQQPATSSPLSRLKRSSEGVIWMCRASFTYTAPVLYDGPALWSPPTGLPKHQQVIFPAQVGNR